MKKRMGVWFCLFSFLWLTVLSLAGQETTGGLTGKVTDDTGAVLHGVSIILNSPALVTKNLKTVTNESGWYLVQALPPGVYSVKASIQGFTTQEKTGIIVEQSQRFRVDFTLTVGKIEETKTVTAASPLVDTTKVSVTNTLETTMLANLPSETVGRRQYSEIIRSLPGVTDDSSQGEGGSPIIYGNRKFDIGYRVEGVQTNDLSYGWFATFVPMDALEEIQVKGVAISADSGWNQGGIVSMRFKSGGNSFHGSASEYFSNNGLWGGTSLKRTDNQATGTLGGPILRDKIWFFLCYEWAAGISDIFGRTDGVRSINHDPQGVAKVTVQLNSTNRLSATYLASPTSRWNYEGNNGPDFPAASLSRTGYDNKTIGADLTSTLSNNLLLESHFDYRYFGRYLSYQGDNPYIYTESATFATLPNGYRAQGQPDGNADAYHQYEANMKLSAFLSGAGEHNTMFGWDMFHWDAKEGLDTRPQYTIYDDSTIPGGIGVLSTQPVPVINPYLSHEGSYALYANDDWVIGKRLSASIGLRFGLDAFYRTNYHLEPRLGINLDPIGDGSRLKASFSRFYGALYLRNISCDERSSTISDIYVFDPTSPTYTGALWSTSLTPASAAINNPNLKTPYTDEFVASYERTITKDISARVSYIRRWQRDQFVFVDGNIDPITGAYLGPTAIPEITNQGIGNYNGLEVVIKKRFSHRYQWQISYNWSKSKNTMDNAYMYYLPYPPNQLAARYGTSDDSIPNFLKAMFSVLLPLDFQVAAYFQYRSGRPYSQYNMAFNDDLTPFVSEFIGVRNQYRLKPFEDFSVHAEKVFAIKKTEIGIIGEVVNVFDNREVTAVYTYGAQFGQTLSTRLGRRYQLAARFRF